MGEIPDRRRVDDGRYADDRRTNRDRRQGPDLLRRILPLFPALSWGCVVLAFFILSLAKPPSQSFVGIFSDQPVYSGWNLELLHYVFWFLFGAIVLGGSGFVLNIMRSKRRGDNIYTSLVFVGLAAFVFLVWLVSIRGV
ncbi:MAG: hypothetical protein RBR02_08305 [Desulfuromonadaceae bacterium]|nr:hypothetical protein [Desulfuromonadaceae bacterium]